MEWSDWTQAFSARPMSLPYDNPEVEKLEFGFVNGCQRGIVLAVGSDAGQLSAYMMTMVICQHPWLTQLKALVKIGRICSRRHAFGTIVCLRQDSSGLIIRDWCQSVDWMRSPRLLHAAEEGPLVDAEAWALQSDVVFTTIDSAPFFPSHTHGDEPT